jgi:uncharacterized protein YkwD
VPLSGSCREVDAGLVSLAESLARNVVTSGHLQGAETVTFDLRRLGLPYVWPVVFSAMGTSPDSLRSELLTWLEGLRIQGQQRCGVAIKHDPTRSRDVLVAVVVDALADVRKIPRRVASNASVELLFDLNVEAAEVSLLVLGPSGLPRQVPARFEPTIGSVRALSSFPARGRWLVQLVATTESGPRPVAEVEVWVDMAVPNSLDSAEVPGESRGQSPSTASAKLWTMLNAARQSERLPELEHDPSLSQLADAHARLMRDQQLTAHDAGDGDPQLRLQHYQMPNGRAVGAIGENVARASTVYGAHRVLWQSPAHRRTLLYKEFTHAGVGVAIGAGGEVWVCELFVGPGKTAVPGTN